MPISNAYRETLYTKHDRFAGEAAWQSFAEHACAHRVLPDGRCDIILRFASDGTKPIGAITPLITGAATRFHIVPIAAGTGYVGARLRPGTAAAVLGIDLRAIANRILVGDAAIQALPALKSVCTAASSVDQLTDRLASFVERRCDPSLPDSLSAGLIDTMHLTGGRMPILDIASLHGLDVRSVRRRMMGATGLGPKQMAMVIQFQRALRLRFLAGLDAASTAFEAGYADQAHMSRVFRQMGGVSPARLPDWVLVGLPI